MQKLTRAERLDRLPFTSRHRRLLLGSGVGWALDAMDVGLIAYILAALSSEWQLDTAQKSLLGSIGFVGMALGASLGGLLADRIGRRQVFALTLLVYGLATGLSALSTGLAMLIVLRFVVGLGLGAELPIASTMVSEFAPARIRGRVVVILEAFWAVGWLAAALIGYFLIPRVEHGWRWALALGAIPAIYSLVVRYGLPESVRFLERQGRHGEAETTVQSFEEAAGIHTPDSDKTPDVEIPAARKVGWRELFQPRFRRSTLGLVLVWVGINFGYYGAFIWLPTLLSDGGMPLVKSFEFTLWMTLAQLPGYAVAAVLVETWGRRPTLVTFLLGSVAGAVLFAMAPQIAGAITPGDDGVAHAVALGSACLLSFFNLGAWGALYAVTPEVFPTDVRATGSGMATAFGRVSAMIAPLVVPQLAASRGLGTVFLLLAAMFAVAVAGALLLPERKGEILAEE